RLEERLYGIFMIAISNRKQELITHADFKQIDEFSLTEKIYLAIVLQTGNKDKVDPEGDINRCHEVALILYEKYKDKGYLSRNLLLSWFSIFISCMKAEETLRKDRKSTRLNSSHVKISYAVFCLKKKKK